MTDVGFYINISKINGVFFSTKKMCTLLKKNAFLCLFLKNVSPCKRVVCFILNNLHFPMVKDIAFYALYKSRVLLIPCKADGFCLFIVLPDENLKKSRLVLLSNLEFNFFIVRNLWCFLFYQRIINKQKPSALQGINSTLDLCRT